MALALPGPCPLLIVLRRQEQEQARNTDMRRDAHSVVALVLAGWLATFGFSRQLGRVFRFLPHFFFSTKAAEDIVLYAFSFEA